LSKINILPKLAVKSIDYLLLLPFFTLSLCQMSEAEPTNTPGGGDAARQVNYAAFASDLTTVLRDVPCCHYVLYVGGKLVGDAAEPAPLIPQIVDGCVLIQIRNPRPTISDDRRNLDHKGCSCGKCRDFDPYVADKAAFKRDKDDGTLSAGEWVIYFKGERLGIAKTPKELEHHIVDGCYLTPVTPGSKSWFRT